MQDVCHRGILLHEIIHVIQNDQNIFTDYDQRTKKHLREMDALVNHNIYLSHGRKILYSNGFAAKFKTTEKTIYTVNFLIGLIIHRNQRNQISVYF